MYNLIESLSEPSALLIISLVLIFVSLIVLFVNILPDPQSIMAIKRLGVEEQLPKESKIFMIRFARLFFQIYLGAIIKMDLAEHRKKIKRKLLTANLTMELTPDEFIAFKIFTLIMIPAVVIFLSTTLGFNMPLWLILCFIPLGFYYPDIWVSQKIKVRKTDILVNLPYAIDVLTLSVEAGLDFIAALTRLIQKTKKNELTEELTQMLKEIRLGTPRADALRNLSDRLQIEEISSFATVLIQADQFGADIGPVLRAQSDQIRVNRFYAAEQAGARASQLILLPMILFIFPTIFLVILGPYFILYMTGQLF